MAFEQGQGGLTIACSASAFESVLSVFPVQSHNGMIARSLLGVEQTVSGGGVCSLSSSLPPALQWPRPAHDDFTFGTRSGPRFEAEVFPCKKRPTAQPGGILDTQWLERRRAVKLTGC